MTAGTLRGRNPVVLVVEDELLVRMDAVDLLEDAGFDTVEAATLTMRLPF
jgi:CheY-like chemotaxis protein